MTEIIFFVAVILLATFMLIIEVPPIITLVLSLLFIVTGVYFIKKGKENPK